MKWLRRGRQGAREFYRGKSMQFMISTSFTLVTLIGVALMSIFLYRSYQKSAENMMAENSAQVLDQVNINLNSYLRNMMRISDAAYYGAVRQVDFGEGDIDSDLSLLYEANKDSLVSLACFGMDGELLGAMPFSGKKQGVDVTGQEWFQSAADKMENLHFSDSHVQNLFENSSSRYYWVVSLSRGVEITRNGVLESGILLVDMDFGGISQLFLKVNEQSMGYVYLTDSSGKIIYHPKQNLIFSNLMEENNERAASYEDGMHKEHFGGEERMVVVKTVGYTGWKIVSVTPMKNLYGSFFRAQRLAILAVLVAALAMTFVTWFVSTGVVKPLKRLEDSVKGIGSLTSPQIYIGGTQEIQHLGETIRSMVVQLRKLTDDIVKEQEEKRKSELDALQSQINPHFLYNTLDSIMWMIEAEKYEEAISMVGALGNLFRISLSKGKNIISIGDEIQHARNYVEIQKYRYKNKFNAFFQVEEGVEKYQTIKLILQPLIENAIYYGMSGMYDDGEIDIRAYVRGEDVFMEVEDNGLGMTREQVSSLLTDEHRVRSKGSGIGLRNVHQRIQLYFGENYGLTIESEPDEGTTVRIHLPAKELLREEIREEETRL